jgi:DNA repair protein REV1
MIYQKNVLLTRPTRTHIIAMNLTPAKVKEYQNMRVVRPEWIMESVKAGSLLHWRDFKLEMETRLDVGQGKRIPQAKLPITQLNRSHPRSQAQPNEVTRPEEAKGSKIVSVDVELTREKAEGSDDLPLGKSPDHGISDPIYMTDPVTLEQAARIPSYALNKSNFAAQRLMAQPGWKEENTAASGTKFINSYYQHSRLHHLSMWKAELKDLVAKAQERFENEQEETQTSETAEDTDSATVPQIGHGVSMKGAELLKTWETASPDRKGKGTAVNVVQRIYMHCDFDCFFVSVGLLDRPNLRGKPVVVCHSQGSGEGAASTSEIASSSYEARAAGIRNGMRWVSLCYACPNIHSLVVWVKHVNFVRR